MQGHSTPCLYWPGGSTGPTVWLQYATACFGWAFDPNLAFKDPHTTLDLTSVPVKWHINLLKGLRRGHESDRQQTQLTDGPCHGEMCRKCVNYSCQMKQC